MSTTPAPRSARWSLLFALLALAAAFAAGRLTGPKSAPPLPPVDFRGDVEVRTDLGAPSRYRPHSVHVDNRPTFVSDDPIRGAVTVVTLDGGRVKIAATPVAENHP